MANSFGLENITWDFNKRRSDSALSNFTVFQKKTMPDAKEISIPIVSKKTEIIDTDKIKGLSLEKTVTNPTKSENITEKLNIVKSNSSTDVKPNETVAKTTDKTVSQGTEEKALQQDIEKGPSLTEVLTDIYGEQYSKLNDEQKRQLMVRYFYHSSRATKGQEKPLDIYESFLKRCTSDDERTLLADVQTELESRDQVGAFSRSTNVGSVHQRDFMRRRGAFHIGRFHRDNQMDIAGMIIGSKDNEAMRICASHAAEVDKSNQVGIVQLFQEAKLSKDFHVEIDRLLINQYGDYAKENQLDIHKLMSTSVFSETVEYAASNIWHFDKENQANAVSITTNTGNKAAMKAAAVEWENYDDSAKNEIKSIILSTNDAEVKEVFEKAEIKAQNKTADVSTPENKNITSSSEDKTDSSESNAGLVPTSVKIQEVVEISNNKQNLALLESKVKSLSDSEKLILLQRCPKSDIIKIILKDNPSMEILSKISPDYVKQIGYDKMIPYLCFLNPQVQVYIVQEAAMNGNLGDIKRSYLAGSVKPFYDKYLNTKNKD